MQIRSTPPYNVRVDHGVVQGAISVGAAAGGESIRSGPMLDGGATPVAADQAKRHLATKLVENGASKDPADSREVAEAATSSNCGVAGDAPFLPYSLEVFKGGLRRGILAHSEEADERVIVGDLDFLCGVLDFGHSELHVGLARAYEDIAEEHVAERCAFASRALERQCVSLVRCFSCRERLPPGAIGIGFGCKGLVVECCGHGRTHDGMPPDIGLLRRTMKDHVITECGR